MDRSAFVGASRSRQELAKPRWRPRLRRTNLRKLACAQVAGLPTLVLAADNSPSPRRLSYSSVWLWSCYRHYLPSDPGGVTPACVPGYVHKYQACLTFEQNPVSAMTQLNLKKSTSPWPRAPQQHLCCSPASESLFSCSLSGL